jgi:hypothetical protein
MPGSTMRLQEHNPRGIIGRVELLRKMMFEGIRDPVMRQVALAATHGCPWRDNLCELEAIWYFMQKNIRYTGDAYGIDTYQSPRRTLQFRGGDCLPVMTKFLREGGELVSFLDLRVGDRISDGSVWTTVRESWLTGFKAILAFDLNNGSTLRCSPDHRLFRLVDGVEQEVRAEEIRPGDQLVDGATIATREGAEGSFQVPMGSATAGNLRDAPMDADLAWLLGVYIADGWTEDYRFAISGRDGKPKEEQKRRVKAIVERLGAATRWHERYIAVNDPAMTLWMKAAGSHAPEKRVPLPYMNLPRAWVVALLEGLAADSGIAASGTVVHSTTSAQLALQLRVLYRMIGRSTHIRRVDDHGGLGTHPIYRVTVRRTEEELTRAPWKVLKVLGVRDDGEDLCGDLTVDGGRFWLPESDTIVHNCDDGSVLLATLAHLNGFPTKLRITKNPGSNQWAHIYSIVGTPKVNPRQWITMDWTLGMNKFGAPPPQSGFLEFDGHQVRYAPDQITLGDYSNW